MRSASDLAGLTNDSKFGVVAFGFPIEFVGEHVQVGAQQAERVQHDQPGGERPRVTETGRQVDARR